MTLVPNPNLMAFWDLSDFGPLPLLISLKRNHSRVSTHLHNADAQLFLRKLDAYSIPRTMG